MLTEDEIRQLIDLEARHQGIDPRLPYAVAKQESGLDPAARGDGGQAWGLFQLHPGAARDGGIDPTQRGDVALNIEAGVRYLKQKLRQAGGNVEQALSLYNRGTPTYQGKGDPNYITNVMRHYGQDGESPRSALQRAMSTAGSWLTPRSADAATGLSPQDAARLQALDAEIARRQGGAQPGPPASSPGQPGASGTVPPRPSPFAPSPWEGGVGTLPEPAAPQWEGGTSVDGVPDVAPSLLQRVGQWFDPTTGPAPSPPQDTPMGQAVGDIDRQAAVRRAAEQQVAEQGPPPGWYKTPAREAINIGLPAAATAAASMTGPAAPVLVPLADIGGSWLAYKLNVALGLEEPSTLGEVASVAVPAAVRGVGGVVKRVVRNLPGASAVKSEVAQELLQDLEQNALPNAVPSSTLYTQAAQQGANQIAVPRMGTTALNILREEAGIQPALRLPASVRRQIEAFSDLVQQYRGQVPLDVLNAHRQRLGLLVSKASSENWPQQRALKAMYAAIGEDLDQAAARGVPGAAALLQANQAFKRERALETMSQLWSEGRGVTVGADGEIQVNAQRITNQFKKLLSDDPLFRQAYTAQEIRDINETLTQITRLTRKVPGGGMIERGTGAGAGATIGGMVGGPPGVAVGAALGTFTPDVIAALMHTQQGRQAVRWALQQGGGRLTPALVGFLNDTARQQLAAPSGMRVME